MEAALARADEVEAGASIPLRVPQPSNEASSVISGTAASAFDTGQFSFAVSAARRNDASSSPAPLPRTVSAIRVIPSPGWNVTVADVIELSAGVPACASSCDSAIASTERARRDQILRARLRRAVLGARLPGQLLLPEHAARRRVDAAASLDQRAVPRDLCSAFRRHRFPLSLDAATLSPPVSSARRKGVVPALRRARIAARVVSTIAEDTGFARRWQMPPPRQSKEHQR